MTSTRRTALSDAVEMALLHGGLSILQDPPRFISNLADVMDAESRDFVAIQSLDTESLALLAAAAETRDAQRLVEAQEVAGKQLSHAGCDKETAQLVAAELVEGIARWRGIEWQRQAPTRGQEHPPAQDLQRDGSVNSTKKQAAGSPLRKTTLLAAAAALVLAAVVWGFARMVPPRPPESVPQDSDTVSVSSDESSTVEDDESDGNATTAAPTETVEEQYVSYVSPQGAYVDYINQAIAHMQDKYGVTCTFSYDDPETPSDESNLGIYDRRTYNILADYYGDVELKLNIESGEHAGEEVSVQFFGDDIADTWHEVVLTEDFNRLIGDAITPALSYLPEGSWAFDMFIDNGVGITWYQPGMDLQEFLAEWPSHDDDYCGFTHLYLSPEAASQSDQILEDIAQAIANIGELPADKYGEVQGLDINSCEPPEDGVMTVEGHRSYTKGDPEYWSAWVHVKQDGTWNGEVHWDGGGYSVFNGKRKELDD